MWWLGTQWTSNMNGSRLYSMVSNHCGGSNKHGGYYIGLFGHCIKNHVYGLYRNCWFN